MKLPVMWLAVSSGFVPALCWPTSVHAQGSSDQLVPLSLPRAESGACTRTVNAKADSSGRHVLLRFNISVMLEGTRLIGVGLDSVGRIVTYTETGTRIVGPQASTSTVIAARVTLDEKVSGFQVLVTGRQVADSTQKDPTIRAPLDSTQQRSAFRVAEWVRKTCGTPMK